MIGKLLAAPVRLLNVPLRAAEKIVDPDDRKDDRILSVPLEAVAEAIEEAVEPDDD